MKNITVITKLKLKPESLEQFRVWFEDWQVFLSKVSQCKSLEVVVETPESVLWYEGWNSHQQLEKFIHEHLIYVDFSKRLFDLCYDCERETFKKIL